MEYNSPYLIPEPGLELCHTGSIEITVFHSGSPNFYWLDPINSNDDVVVLEDPGTYLCEITQCGFTVTETITIEDSGFQAYIEAVDTLLCEGEEFVLTSNEGMSTYEWSNGVETLSSQLLITEPGTYDVFVTSSNGCTSQSEPITVGYYDYWQFPVSESIVICDSTSAVLTVEGTGEFTWYDSTMSNVLAMTDTFVTPLLTTSTSYFVIASDSLCTSSPVEVNVIVDAASIIPVIILDSIYCEGETVILSSNSQGDFLWTLPDMTTSTENQLVIPNISLTDQGEYTLQTSSNNCMSDIATASFVVDSMVSIELFYEDSIVCQDSLLLTTVGDYENIQWIFDEQIIDEDNSTLWSSLVGVYTVVVTNANGTCFASDQVSLTNNSSIQAPNVVTDESICAGQTIEIFLGLENPFWATDPQLSDIQFNNFIVSDVLTEDVVYYVGQIDEGGYYSEVSLLNVEVFTSPAPNLSYNDPICEGGTLVLTTDLPNSSIEWTLPDNTTTTTIQQPLIISEVDLTNQGQYSAIAIDNECVTEIGSINVSINTNPPPPVIIGESEYCQGDEVSLLYENFQADSISTWTIQGALIVDSVFSLPSISSSFTIVASVYSGVCMSSSTIEIVMHQNPSVGDLYTNSPICFGDELTLSTDSIAGNSYVWNGPLSFSATSNEANVSSAIMEHGGEYIVQVTDLHNCVSEASIVVQVLAYPIVDLGADTIICPGVPILLTVDEGYDSYLWDTGDFSHDLLVQEGGIYSVEVANGPCWVIDEIEIIEDCNLVFAPNIITPNGDLLNDKLYFESPMIKTLNVYVYNRWGNLVGEWHDLAGYWDGTHFLTGVDLAEGSYYYVLDYIDIKGERHAVKSYITLVR